MHSIFSFKKITFVKKINNIMSQDLYQAPDYFLMDELLTEEHKLVRDTAREWVKREVSPIIEDACQKAEFPNQIINGLGEIGAYRFWWRKNTIASTILSNRGCRARCSFCSVRNFNGKGVRGRTYLSVVDELQYLKEVHGVNHVMWLDDDLLFDRERTINMFNEMVRRNLDITWDASNGIIASALKDEVLDAAAESGCIGMHFGIESGNDEILKSVHKPSGKKHYLELENKLQKYPQIFTKGFLMVGFPNETLSQMQETIDMAVKINLDWYTIQVVHPLPKTEMHQQMVEMGLITDDKVEDEKLNYGNRSGKRKKIEQGNDISHFNDPFKGDLNLVPKKELMEDIWFTADFKVKPEAFQAYLIKSECFCFKEQTNLRKRY